jgi:hypothetical protein
MLGVTRGLPPAAQARLVLGLAAAIIGGGILGPDLLAIAFAPPAGSTVWHLRPTLCWSAALATLVIVRFGCLYQQGHCGEEPRWEISQRFPKWLERPMTLGTGKAPRGGRPLWRKTWKFHLAWPMASLFAGTLISCATAHLLYYEPILFAVYLPLPTAAFALGWTLVVGSARHIQVNCVHQIVHNRFSGCPNLDYWIGHFAGSLLILQDLDAYRRDHVGVHHQFRYLGTRVDPDAKFILQLGFHPGMSRDQAWKHFNRLCVSPLRFHGVFLKDRLTSNSCDKQTTWIRRVMFALVQGSILVLVTWTSFARSNFVPVLDWLLAWAFPLSFLYQVSAFAQFCGEHYWKLNEGPRDIGKFKGRKRTVIAKLTNGRFFGDYLPPKNLSGSVWFLAWTWWWLRFALLHLPARFAVMPGPLPCHDWHHRNETDERWPDSAYARQADIESRSDWGVPYTETWGLASSLDAVFGSLSLLGETEQESSSPNMLGM